MNKCKLGDVASVIISNVDKKSYENEIKVKLCNFTDVYYNWAITLRDEPKLMIATATNNEICKYKLHKGDVAITKDSETKEDIGQSTLIADEIPDMLLGYHCALIRPNTDKLLGAYLNAVLHTKLATRYFELNASGSGQRYTLSVDAINDFQLYLPSINEQERISKILTDIDRKIENNTCINDNLAQQVNALYDYWFTQFDFPDENNKPYRSSGGQMVWNELLKKEIPIGWSVKPIIEFSHIYQPQTISNSLFNEEYPYYVYGGGGLIGKYNKYNHAESEIIISCRGNCGNVLISMPNSWITGNAMVVHPDETVTKRYLYEFLRSYGVEKYISGSVQKQLTRENISIMPIIVPPKPILNKFDAVASRITDKQQSLFAENQELMRLRNWILPLLMNGQATIAE